MTTLGARLRALRRQSGLTQRSLAEGLVTKSMISQIESDKVQPSQDLLCALAERLGATVEELLPAKLQDQERLARYRQAQAFLSLTHYEEALPLLQSCLHSPLPTWSLVQLTYQTAFCLQQLRRYEEARRTYEEAVRLAREEQETRAIVRSHQRLGEIAFVCDDLNLAVQEWKFAYQELKALTLGEESPEDRAWAAELCLHLARTYRELGRYQEAVGAYLEAGEPLAALPLRKQADIACGLGQAYGKLGDYKKAEMYLRQARTLCQKGRERKRLMQVEWELALLLHQIERAEEAWPLLDACQEWAERTEHHGWHVRVVCEKAKLLQTLGRNEAAVTLLTETKASVQGVHQVALLQRALARFYLETGALEQALQEAQQAKEGLQKSPDEEEWAQMYQLLADLYKSIGDYRQASDCQERVNQLLQNRVRQIGWLL